MRQTFYSASIILFACSLACTVAAQESQRRGGPGGPRGGGSGLGNYEKPPAANEIPEHAFDLILGRPTDRSIEVRVLHNADGTGHIDYRAPQQSEWSHTSEVKVEKGKPIAVVLDSLISDAEYKYRWVFDGRSKDQSLVSDEYAFHTARASGQSFVFSVTADSHLDENSSGEVYIQTLRNALADRPDFHLELGDTFMTGKYVKPEYSYGQYLAQRYYLSHLCSSAPLFLVIGNHDGESAGRSSLKWATTTRKSLFPNPSPNHFFTGNQSQEPTTGTPDDYYAWQWGDAQFIVLDPYRYTTARRRGGAGGGRGGASGSNNQEPNKANAGSDNRPLADESNWYWTLGEAQYRWLQRELAKPSKYRFVFIHHLVGGAIQNQRGGVEVASLWEWGGHNQQGADEFKKFRPSWEKPIHQMLVESGVSIVFHGHDHLFVKQDLNGIVYQEVPQPSQARTGNTRTAAEYGYLSGEIQPSSGYVRVRVEPDALRVDYVRTSIGNGRTNMRNGEVTYSYEVKALP